MLNVKVDKKYQCPADEEGGIFTYKGAYISISYACNTDICSYCYARAQRVNRTMTVDSFRNVLRWMKEISNCTGINLVGGEPTIIPSLDEYLDTASMEGFDVTIYTNGRFEASRAVELSGHPAVTEVIFHYEPLFFENYPDHREQLVRNLRILSQKNLGIIYCITSSDFEYKECLALAREFHAQLRWIFATPTSGGTPFMTLEEMKGAGARLQEFLLHCRSEGVKTVPDLSVPICVFDRDFLETNAEDLGLVKLCYPFVSIEPDLSTRFCTSVSETRCDCISDSESLRRAILESRSARKRLNRRLAFRECKECPEHNVSCQGGCLTYKVYTAFEGRENVE